MLALLLACEAEEVAVDPDPDELDFGEVLVTGEEPYAERELTLTNVGEAAVSFVVPEQDARVCLVGFEDMDFPVDLGDVRPGSAYLFHVGICGHEAGAETDETEVVVHAGGRSVAVPVRFTALFEEPSE